MKIYRLPAKINALAFDMDLTLYTNPEYGRYQTDSLVERLGKIRGLSLDEMSLEIEDVRKAWALSHNGKRPSLSNVLGVYGISMEENIRWRNEIYEPERFLTKDPRLGEILYKFSRSCVLGVVTNNPILVAHRTLTALGVEDFFPIIIGLDTCMLAKPHKIPFVKFCELSSCPPETCVSIGDRYDMDLDLPLEMGMGGILVDGVEDVYELPGILKKNH